MASGDAETERQVALASQLTILTANEEDDDEEEDVMGSRRSLMAWASEVAVGTSESSVWFRLLLLLLLLLPLLFADVGAVGLGLSLDRCIGSDLGAEVPVC